MATQHELHTSDPLRLLTAREAAAKLAISQRKLWAITEAGEVKCIRIGRSVRYDVQDLLDFVASKRQGRGDAASA